MKTSAAIPGSSASSPRPLVRRRLPRLDPWTLAVFGCAALLVLVGDWSNIRADNVEIGDFAANSLLVQDAKSFALWTGNYSRLGFNHPGPAILYVLAAGEVVFHDWLRLVRSPFSGQLIAVALYNAAWIAVIFRRLAAATGDRRIALLETALFCCAATLIDHDVAGGAWFPHLYFFPFAAFVVAAARTADGLTDALPVLATSAGFLVDGHVSFGVFTAVVVVVIVAVNAVRFRAAADRRILAIRFLRAHAGRIAGAVAIFAIFLAPLVVETLRDWPGPVAAYVGYGASQPPQPWADVLVFVGVYWGGLAPLAGAIAIWTYLLRDGRVARPLHDHAWSIAVAAAAATVALFVYGRYGVDDLKFRYVGIFYYAIPAATVAVSAVVAIVVPARRSLAIVLTAIACVVGFFVEVSRTPHYVEQYNDVEALTLYRSLASASPGRRIVLDLDTRGTFDAIWTRLAGAEAYAKRRGSVPFCIRRNWHILFTKAAKCRPDEIDGVPHYVVRAGDAPVDAGATPAFTSAGLRFYRLAVPDVVGARTLTIAANLPVFADHMLDENWSIGEGDHVWTIARTAHIELPLEPGFRGVVTLDVDSFLPHEDSTQALTVGVDGVVARTVAFTRANPRQSIAFPIATRPGASSVDIELRIRSPISPLRAGVGADPRQLGVSLYGLEIRPDGRAIRSTGAE